MAHISCVLLTRHKMEMNYEQCVVELLRKTEYAWI